MSHSSTITPDRFTNAERRLAEMAAARFKALGHLRLDEITMTRASDCQVTWEHFDATCDSCNALLTFNPPPDEAVYGMYLGEDPPNAVPMKEFDSFIPIGPINFWCVANPPPGIEPLYSF